MSGRSVSKEIQVFSVSLGTGFVSVVLNECVCEWLCVSTEVQNLDTLYATNPSSALYKKRLLLQSQYDMLSSSIAER